MRLIGRAVVLVVSLVLAPPVAEAQERAKVPRIGCLANNPAAAPHLLEAFRQRLRDLGYVEGHNLVICHAQKAAAPEGLIGVQKRRGHR